MTVSFLLSLATPPALNKNILIQIEKRRPSVDSDQGLILLPASKIAINGSNKT